MKTILLLSAVLLCAGCQNLSVPKITISYDPATGELIVDNSKAKEAIQVYKATNDTVIVRSAVKK